MTEILLVDDDLPIRHLVRDVLEGRGLTVTETGSVASAKEALRQRAFDVVILDLTLPDGSGFEVLDDIRQTSAAAHVIVLSGATTELDRIRALDLGADDYVVKPFFARELAARVLAVSRRRNAGEQAPLRIGPLEIDLVARGVTVNGTPLQLTAKEFDLLAFLASRPGHVFSRNELLRAVWQAAPEWQQAATVTEHIRRVRTKLAVDPGLPSLLRTVRGAGYRFDLPAEASARARPAPAALGTLTYLDGRVVHADLAAATMLGRPDIAALIGGDVLELVAPRSADAARRRLKALQSGTALRSQVITFSCLDGTEVALEVRSAAVDWLGQVAIRAELRLATVQSKMLRHLATGVASEVSDAVIVTDLNVHIRSWNRAAERLYGWTESEVLGRHLFDVLEWYGEADQCDATLPNLEVTDPWRGEGSQTTRDGSTVHVWASTTLVREEDGSPVGIVSVNRPVVPMFASGRPEPTSEDIAEVRRGIGGDEFVVYYQPVVTLADQRIITVEALVRWNHPTRGLLTPDRFIDTAEQSGLIVELGTFVLRSACEQVAAWRRAGWDVSLAVNLSARELSDPPLVDRITTITDSAGLSPTALWLEITETALVEDVEQASATLHRLAALGIGISIDDFGTGWASLTYLRAFPIHVLKIDRAFVEGIDVNPNDAAIVRSILSLGAELGLTVVAEGIETASQQHALETLGCAIGQGYLYGKPTAAAEVPIDRMHRTSSDGDADVTPAAPPRLRGSVGAAAGELAHAAGVAHSHADLDTVADMLRGLLRIYSAAEASELLQQTVEDLGGTVVLAADAVADALDVDVSLGQGPPLAVEGTPSGATVEELADIVPELADDAQEAVELLRRQELEEPQSSDEP